MDKIRKEETIKLMKEELKEIENMVCLTIKDYYEQRNAIHILKNSIVKIEYCEDYNNEKGKELLNKLLEGLN